MVATAYFLAFSTSDLTGCQKIPHLAAKIPKELSVVRLAWNTRNLNTF